MPATTRYASYRRKSSLINGLTPVKAGNYGIVTSPRSSPRTVVFAPNVTPGTYIEPEPAIDEDSPLPPSPSDALFPPSLNPDSTQSRRRVPPGKRRSQGYIPRPPNAFMLFRADFVRQKHVPGSIETNHGSLSKIIGNCWRALPLEEKKVWETLAKQAKVKHQKLYPEYRFRPVHNKAKKQAREAAKAKAAMTPQDEQRCEDVAAMLLDGKKGDELAAAVRDYDTIRALSDSPMDPMMHAPIPTHVQGFEPLHTYAGPSNTYQFARRPSSVPLPSISLPSLPFYLPHQQMMQSASRPESPISHYARSRIQGSRRPSSAAPVLDKSWEMPSYFPAQLQHDNDPLPEVPHGIFEQSFLGQDGFSWGVPQEQSQDMGFGAAVQQPDLGLSISPLDNSGANDAMSSASTAISHDYTYLTPNTNDTYFNMSHFLPTLDPAVSSGPSSAFSGSPAASDTSLPIQPAMNLHAPKPQHPVGFEPWEQQGGMEVMPIQDDFGMGAAHVDFNPALYTMGHHTSDLYPCGPETTNTYHYQNDMPLELSHY